MQNIFGEKNIFVRKKLAFKKIFWRKSLAPKNSWDRARAERAILGIFGRDRRGGVEMKNWRNGRARKKWWVRQNFAERAVHFPVAL